VSIVSLNKLVQPQLSHINGTQIQTIIQMVVLLSLEKQIQTTHLHQPLQGTIYYYCVITLSSGGCSAIKSNTAAVTILSHSNNGATFSYSKSFVGVYIPSIINNTGGSEILPPMVF
jgi:hypothetical protein